MLTKNYRFKGTPGPSSLKYCKRKERYTKKMQLPTVSCSKRLALFQLHLLWWPVYPKKTKVYNSVLAIEPTIRKSHRSSLNSTYRKIRNRQPHNVQLLILNITLYDYWLLFILTLVRYYRKLITGSCWDWTDGLIVVKVFPHQRLPFLISRDKCLSV